MPGDVRSQFSPRCASMATDFCPASHSKRNRVELASLRCASSNEAPGEAVLAPAPSRKDRMAMHNANKLKIGLFGANCSSGRAVTLVPERWSGSWPDNLKLARMADEAGPHLLPPTAPSDGSLPHPP